MAFGTIKKKKRKEFLSMQQMTKHLNEDKMGNFEKGFFYFSMSTGIAIMVVSLVYTVGNFLYSIGKMKGFL